MDDGCPLDETSESFDEPTIIGRIRERGSRSRF
jgi:hypothetical protein